MSLQFTVIICTWRAVGQDPYLCGSHTKPYFGKEAGRIDLLVSDATVCCYTTPNKAAEIRHQIRRNVSEKMAITCFGFIQFCLHFALLVVYKSCWNHPKLLILKMATVAFTKSLKDIQLYITQFVPESQNLAKLSISL